MRLSKDFTFDELTRTGHLDLLEANRDQAPVKTLERLARYLLQPIRDAWGPVNVTSGFRCKELNERVGGSPRSQHLLGEAADIVIASHKSEKDREVFCGFMLDMYKAGCFGFHQVLLEPNCIHVSLPTGYRDGEIAYWEKKQVNGVWHRTKRQIRKADNA